MSKELFHRVGQSTINLCPISFSLAKKKACLFFNQTIIKTSLFVKMSNLFSTFRQYFCTSGTSVLVYNQINAMSITVSALPSKNSVHYLCHMLGLVGSMSTRFLKKKEFELSLNILSFSIPIFFNLIQ